MDFYNIYRIPRRSEPESEPEPKKEKNTLCEIIMKPINTFILNPINYYKTKYSINNNSKNHNIENFPQ